MITGFFDDGYGLGVPTKIVLSPGTKKKTNKLINDKKKETYPRIDGKYVFLMKGIFPYDIMVAKNSK